MLVFQGSRIAGQEVSAFVFRSLFPAGAGGQAVEFAAEFMEGIVRIILGSSYIPIIPLLQGGGSS